MQVLLPDDSNFEEVSESSESSKTKTEQENCYDSENCNCDHFNSILKMQGLKINVLTEEENMILDLIYKVS